MTLEEAHQKVTTLEDRLSAARSERDAIIRQERENGATYYALAKRTGLTQPGIKKICLAGGHS